MKKENLSLNQKLVSVSIMLPFIADTIEDLLDNTTIRKDIFDKHMVNNARTLIKKFRKTDNELIGTASIQAIDQQSEMYIALKQFLIENLIITE